MAGIEDEIRVRKEEIATLERRVEILRAQIEAFELALQYAAPTAIAHTNRSAVVSPSAPAPSGSYRGGRQQGAISNRWKTNLRDLLRLNRPVMVEDIIKVVASNEHGREIRPAEARRLFEGYGERGFVIVNADGSFSITEGAIEKFGLRAAEMETPPEGGESDSGDGDGSQGSATHPAPAGSTPVVSTVSHRAKEQPIPGSPLFSAYYLANPPIKR